MRSIAASALIALCAVSMASSFSARYYRNTDSLSQEKGLTVPEQALSQLDGNATSVQMALNQGKPEEAQAKAAEMIAAADKAVILRLLDRAAAEEIGEKAVEVQEAINNGDSSTAVQVAEELNKKVNEAAANNSDLAAQNLKKAENEKHRPALTKEEDLKLLRAAVTDVITNDPNVPPEKMDAAINHTVKAIAQGMQQGNITNEDMKLLVETQAANQNLTNATQPEEPTGPQDRHWGYNDWNRGRPWHRRRWDDRPWWVRNRYHNGRWWHGRRWWDHNRRRWRDETEKPSEVAEVEESEVQPNTATGSSDKERLKRHWWGGAYSSYYNPYYHYGYGYNSCLSFWSYPFCRRRLFADYAYYGGYHRGFYGK